MGWPGDAFLPDSARLLAMFGVGAASAVMLGAGRVVLGRQMPAETCLVAGWGLVCLVFTAWAALTPFTLTPALLAACLLGLLGLSGAWRGPAVWGGSWRLAPLTLAIWLVMGASRPSQPDTWLNLLPNAAYLVDHGRLPAHGAALSYSFLPVAPNNTQFVAYIASALSGGLAVNAMALFNILLQCAAGLGLARVMDGSPYRAPRWWACAAGLLLAMPLNPGFLPKVFFSGYGEAPLAVTLMVSVQLGVRLLDAARQQRPARSELLALALVLAALVNIKQSSIGLVLPLAASLLAVGLACPGLDRRRWAGLVASATLPALLLWALWRWYVAHDFADGELTVLPLAKWHTCMMPQILGGIARAMAKSPIYTACMFAVTAGWIAHAKKQRWDAASATLSLVAGTILLFNFFLLATYVSHFPADWAADAHSYVRYVSQLSLAVVLALVTRLRPRAVMLCGRLTEAMRARLGAAIVTLAAVWPLPLAWVLRGDLGAPQPYVWSMAERTVAFVAADSKLGLVMPGDDDDALGSLIRGVLLFAPPRRPALDFAVERTADGAALTQLAARGVNTALVTCAPPGGLVGLPEDTAGVVAFDGHAWSTLAVWPYPPGFNDRHFAAWLPHAPLCGHDSFSRAQIGYACRAEYPPRISAAPAPPRRPCVRPEATPPAPPVSQAGP